jgi:hypothetical protein
MNTREQLKAAFDTWLRRLGLLWWEIEVCYYDDPGEIIKRFRDPGGDIQVLATTYAEWKYAAARIEINLPAFDGLEADKIERVVVHELCHILVNEMREDDLHHEERVVTGLTKAMFWIERDAACH